jgi:hypothetical protein
MGNFFVDKQEKVLELYKILQTYLSLSLRFKNLWLMKPVI